MPASSKEKKTSEPFTLICTHCKLHSYRHTKTVTCTAMRDLKGTRSHALPGHSNLSESSAGLRCFTVFSTRPCSDQQFVLSKLSQVQGVCEGYARVLTCLIGSPCTSSPQHTIRTHFRRRVQKTRSATTHSPQLYNFPITHKLFPHTKYSTVICLSLQVRFQYCSSPPTWQALYLTHAYAFHIASLHTTPGGGVTRRRRATRGGYGGDVTG